eukprot:3491478-Amphidinium_carterae.1
MAWAAWYPRHPYVSTGMKFLQWLDGQLQKDEPSKLFVDEYRNYVWVEDLVAVTVKLIEDFPGKPPAFRLMHCGGPDSLNRMQVAESLAAAKGYALEYKSEDGMLPRTLPTQRAEVDLGLCKQTRHSSSLPNISMCSALCCNENYFVFRCASTGYPSPLCIRFSSDKVEAFMGRPMRAISECIGQSKDRI